MLATRTDTKTAYNRKRQKTRSHWTVLQLRTMLPLDRSFSSPLLFHTRQIARYAAPIWRRVAKRVAKGFSFRTGQKFLRFEWAITQVDRVPCRAQQAGRGGAAHLASRQAVAHAVPSICWSRDPRILFLIFSPLPNFLKDITQYHTKENQLR